MKVSELAGATTYPEDRVRSFIEQQTALSHHGVKGQKWGVRRFGRTPAERLAKVDRRISRTKTRIKNVSGEVSELRGLQKDVAKNGVNSDSFKNEFGNHSSNIAFALTHNRTKTQALSDHKNDIQYELDNAQHALGFHQDRLRRHQEKRAKLVASAKN